MQFGRNSHFLFPLGVPKDRGTFDSAHDTVAEYLHVILMTIPKGIH